MQIYVVKKDGKNLRLGLKDANTTIIEPIIEHLNSDKSVEFARYIVDHPDLDDPILEVQVSKGSPESAVKKAAAAVGQYFST